MPNVQHGRSKRIWRRATVLGGLALAGVAVGGIAFGAAAKPSMQVLPSPKGLKYSQTVQVKAKNLPKGSGTIALTIACSTLVNGGGGAQLGLLLQSPGFACSQVAGAAQGNDQLADACSQLATALQPYSRQLGDALSPALGLLP